MDMQTVPADIVMIVKTQIFNSDLKLNGYMLFRHDTVRLNCGGLCVYVRDYIDSHVR